MAQTGKFYITTPIYYPSDRLHVGHAYTTTAADALARWHRFLGEDVFFLTGSDEHGQKIQRKAQDRGVTPRQYVDEIVATFKRLWERLDISYDRFIRTTDADHEQVVQHVFQTIYDKGDIYKSTYEGWYCVQCETFWLESKLVDGKCPDCGRPVELLQEESYFFRLSKYADRLLRHIEEHPEFIQPPGRRNEMVAFIRQGLEDLCVSRTTFDWGVPVPVDSRHVVYVWFDALTNYLTGVGYLRDDARFRRYWPADVHLVGKEIVRFHTIIWPIILMALDLPLPRRVFGHGWLLFDQAKMSKSKGNVVDPDVLIDRYGSDAIRYFLLREISFGQDGNFSEEALVDRINADLANDLGNLVYRSLTMLERYADGVVPQPGPPTALDRQLQDLARQVAGEARSLLDDLQINTALAAIWRFIGRANKYIDQAEPWREHARRDQDPQAATRLATVLYNLAEALRVTALLVGPFLPRTARSIWEQLGISQAFESQRWEDLAWGRIAPGTRTRKGQPLFPRIETKRQEAGNGPKALESTPVPAATTSAGAPAAPADGIITIDEFARVDLRVATILEAEPVKGSDRLLKLRVDLGEGRPRQVVAGIARWYRPEDLPGKQIVVVANLKPARLRGEISEGMLLAGSTEDGKLALVTPEAALPPGSKVK
ncbi:methionine--tRNA ligase [Carboxydochorda subterranea]|uniref:Methionine--tRNA ligase n=1 Tax=Carboxydichorda subterranea TaxID=3109565 RepID=A0ABZ1BYI0_9FIRM|nr:methionine--tRNA ligase [Limnochorda sp. L945t]WRP17640.1 methionine--tRNA ligase [Limnochorda sp. L945t]